MYQCEPVKTLHSEVVYRLLCSYFQDTLVYKSNGAFINPLRRRLNSSLLIASKCNCSGVYCTLHLGLRRAFAAFGAESHHQPR